MPSTRAKQLRTDMTDAERRLWSLLRDRRPAGYKFRRQRPVGPFILDFACLEYRLAIEVDRCFARNAQTPGRTACPQHARCAPDGMAGASRLAGAAFLEQRCAGEFARCCGYDRQGAECALRSPTLTLPRLAARAPPSPETGEGFNRNRALKPLSRIAGEGETHGEVMGG
jgi:hypothetical protein